MQLKRNSFVDKIWIFDHGVDKHKTGKKEVKLGQTFILLLCLFVHY